MANVNNEKKLEKDLLKIQKILRIIEEFTDTNTKLLNIKNIITDFVKISKYYTNLKPDTANTTEIINKINTINTKIIQYIEQDVSNIETINIYTNIIEQNNENSLSYISNVFEYILYKNNDNEINAITGTKDDKDNKKIKYTLTKIKGLNDIDTSLKDKISQTINYEYKKILQNDIFKKITEDAKPKEIPFKEPSNKLKKVIESIKVKIKNIEKIEKIENKSSEISDVFQYILYKSNNKLKAITVTINDKKINYIITEINKSDDIDTSIQGGIPKTIKDVLLNKENKNTGGSLKKKTNNRLTKKEKTRKSITKRKNKWINRKSHKYIK